MSALVNPAAQQHRQQRQQHHLLQPGSSVVEHASLEVPKVESPCELQSSDGDAQRLKLFHTVSRKIQTPGSTAAVVATAVGEDSAMSLPHCNMGSKTTAVATAQQLVAKACHPPSQIPAAAGCADDAVATAAARD